MPGVTEEGDTEQDGRGVGPDTEQARETALEKPPSDVNVRTSFPALPHCIVKLEVAGLTIKSGPCATSKFKSAELLDPSGSGSLAETLTLFVHCPTSVKVIGIVIVAVADAASGPRVQPIGPSEGAVHDPRLVVAADIVPPPCKESVRVTLSAVAGPLLTTVRVTVCCVPVVMLVVEAVWVTAKSAGFTRTVIVALLLSPTRSG